MKKIVLLIVILMGYWSIQAQLTLEFNTSLSAGTEVTLPLNGTVNVIVDWGDGNSESYTTAGDKTHTYVSEGIYIVTISGTLTHFGKWNFGYSNVEKITKVTSFGNVGLTSLNGAFYQAINLTEVPNQIPSSVNDIAQMFYGATSFNHDIGAWDVSNVDEMYGIFESAISFNQDIGSWIVNRVTDMNSMFKNASSYNQDLNRWVLGNVTNMSSMFSNASSFNHDLTSWDLSKLENTDSMFYSATSFNGNISTWNVFKVSSMRAMFEGAVQFNQDISGWNVFKVTDMTSMFEGAISFNQDIGAWDVKKVTIMNRMFYNAVSFNQDISDWNITSVTSMVDMFFGVTLSTAFYNNILIEWVTKNINNNVVFNAGNSTYTTGAAADARSVLISTYHWIISDGGIVNNIVISTQTLTNINMYSATSGGIITDDAGNTITARGVVWNITKNPTTSNYIGITTDGTGIGSYSSNITGLIPGNTYYARAYATNAKGTEYGNSYTFTAQQELTLSGNFVANSKKYDSKITASINSNSLSLASVDAAHPDVGIINTIVSFNDASVGNGKVVSIINSELIGTDAYKYSLSLNAAPTSTANITSKGLYVSNAIALNKIYDGSTTAIITDATLTGVIPGDNVDFDETTGAFNSKSVGTNKNVTSTITISGSEAANYTLIQPTGLTSNITPKELNVIYNSASNKVYDGTTSAEISESTLVGLIAGDEVIIESINGYFADKNVGNEKTVNITVNITGNDFLNYSFTQPTGIYASISPKSLTVNNVSAINKVYDGNTVATLTASNLIGIISGDDVAIKDTIGAFNTKTVENNKAINTALTLNGADANNYSLVQPSGVTANITSKELNIINAKALNKPYNKSKNITISGASIVGIVSGDNVFLDDTIGLVNDINIGTQKPVTALISIVGTDASNYSLIQPTGLSVNITPAALNIINAKATNKEYDGTNVALIKGATLVGVLSGDMVTIDLFAGTFENKNVGFGKNVISQLTLRGKDMMNYSIIQPTDLVANITPKYLTVSRCVVNTKDYDGTTATNTISATLNGIISGDNVEIDTIVANFNDKYVGRAKTVNAIVFINGIDADNYTVTQPTDLKSAINAKQLTITNAVTLNKVYDGSTAATITEATLSGVITGDTVVFAKQNGTFNNKKVGINKKVTSEFTITGIDATNYTLVQPTGLTANISPASLTVDSAIVSNKTYDGTTLTEITNAVLIGIILNDDVTIGNTSANFDDKNVGNNKPVTSMLNIVGSDAANYTLTHPTGLSANIAPKELYVIDVVVNNKVYDGNATASIAEASFDGAVLGDDITFADLSAVFNDKNAGTLKEVTPYFSLSGNDTINYTFFQPTGLKADITPAKLSISGSFSVFDKEYDGTTNATINENNLYLTGIISPDNIELINLVVNFSQPDVRDNLVVEISSAELGGIDFFNYYLSLDEAPTSRAAIKVIVGIGNEDKSEVVVYPNPFTNYFNIRSKAEVNKITLLNIAGQKEFVKNTKVEGSINTSKLNRGVYFINIELISGEHKTIKLLKN